MGGRAIVYYMVTTLLAVFLGIALVTTIRPGAGQGQYLEDDEGGSSSAGRNVTTADTLMDLVRNMFPPNIVQATLQQYRTTLKYPGNVTAMKLGRPNWAQPERRRQLCLISQWIFRRAKWTKITT